MIKYNRVTRRHFLMGAGGFALAIPLLPSLLSKQAIANVIDCKVHKPRFLFLECGVNGGLRYSNWYPTTSNLIKQANPLYTVDGFGKVLDPSVQHFIHAGPIELTNGGISPAWDSKFAPLKNKMNFLRGLDIMFAMVHHSAILGNYNATNTRLPLKSLPSIDQVIAYLRDKTCVIEPVMNIAPNAGVGRSSFLVMGSITNPSSTPNATAKSPNDLFNSLFNRILSDQPKQKEYVADRVLSSFNDLMKSAFGDGNKLGSEDKLRLDEHISVLHDIQTRLNTDRTLACNNTLTIPNGLPKVSEDRAQIAARLKLMNDIVIAAFRCDASRIATYRTMSGSEGTSLPNYHDISHTCHLDRNPALQPIALEAKKYVIDNVIFDLVNKLNNQIDFDGNPMLDNSLVMVTDESSMVSHGNMSQPCVTFGSASGYFKTGQYIDYRHRGSAFYNIADKFASLPELKEPNWAGIPWNRFLATILQSMGIAPDQFEQRDSAGNLLAAGYGDPHIDLGAGNLGTDRRVAYNHQLADMSKLLPLLKKA